MLKDEMLKVGFVVSPNNIHRLPGDIMYAGHPGVWTCVRGQELQVMPNRIRVFKATMFGDALTPESWVDTTTVAMFSTLSDFTEWAKINGVKNSAYR